MGHPLPASVAFDYPNIEALAFYLLEQLFPAASAPDRTAPNGKAAAARTAEATASEINVQQLSDREIAAFIDDELAALVGKGQRP